DPRDYGRVLNEWNQGSNAGDSSAYSCAAAELQRWAERAPERTAIVSGSERLSYAELWARVCLLSRGLQGLARPGQRIAVLMGRNVDHVATLFALLHAGFTYVPIDLRWPKERVLAVLGQVRPTWMVTDRSAASEGLELEVPVLDVERLLRGEPGRTFEAPTPPTHPELPAYVLFTSGSTGKPKGIAVSRRNLSAFIEFARGAFSQEELACVAATTTTAFDLSIFELFVPLASGGAVYLCEDLFSLPSEPVVPITLLNTVPSLLEEYLFQRTLPRGLRTVCLAGEPLPAVLVTRLHRSGIRSVWNLYGPTETTTYSTGAEVPRDVKVPSLGRPIRGTRVYVLDEQLRPVEVGVTGELFIGGAGVSLGYCGDPRGTAARYVPDPFGAPGSRLYRTGDFVRWDRAGSLEYVGRRDDQVKVHGVRIELSEIETVLRSLPGIRSAAVTAERSAHETTLVAYVVSEDAVVLDATRLTRALAERLHPAAVPRRWLQVPALPVNERGKLNRRALAEQQAAAIDARAEVSPPRTETEHALLEIWRELLPESGEIGVHDDFFAAGGNSLLLTRLLYRIREVMGVAIQVADLDHLRSIAALAGHIENIRWLRDGSPSFAGATDRGEL
ncbi:MAG TPA: non-ribosomal peptide synthetase, partial [Polyangiaceae bacterium]|nr:non-ribosomal peptide synthetase [Polyangiaceae bacterium]